MVLGSLNPYQAERKMHVFAFAAGIVLAACTLLIWSRRGNQVLSFVLNASPFLFICNLASEFCSLLTQPASDFSSSGIQCRIWNTAVFYLLAHMFGPTDRETSASSWMV